MRKQVGWAVGVTTAVAEPERNESLDLPLMPNLGSSKQRHSNNMGLLVERAVERANISPSQTVAGMRIRKLLKKYGK